jgi:hydrogenase nickel incorporation protein HypB
MTSVPEGDDKPLKYPLIFASCDLVIVNKIDYLRLEPFDVEAFTRRVKQLNPGVSVCKLSCWLEWLQDRLRSASR